MLVLFCDRAFCGNRPLTFSGIGEIFLGVVFGFDAAAAAQVDGNGRIGYGVGVLKRLLLRLLLLLLFVGIAWGGNRIGVCGCSIGWSEKILPCFVVTGIRM